MHSIGGFWRFTFTVVHRFIVLVCMCAGVVRKQRVETYLHPDTVAQLENDYEDSVSAVIRAAINEKLKRDTQ